LKIIRLEEVYLVYIVSVFLQALFETFLSQCTFRQLFQEYVKKFVQVLIQSGCYVCAI